MSSTLFFSVTWHRLQSVIYSVKEGLKGQGSINGEDTCQSNMVLATVFSVSMKRRHQEGGEQTEEKKIASLT